MIKEDSNYFFKIAQNGFKHWCNEMYYKNTDERESFGLQTQSREEYFKNNKWFLKNTYKGVK